MSLSVRPSFCLYFLPRRTTLPLDGFSWNVIFEYFFENPPRKFLFHRKCDKNNKFWCFADRAVGQLLRKITRVILYGDQFTVMITYRSILRMRIVSDESCRENQNTHFMFNNPFFLENRAVYEIMWKNAVEPDRPHDNMTRANCMVGNWGYRYTQNMQYLLQFHSNKGCKNAPQYYVICTLSDLFPSVRPYPIDLSSLVGQGWSSYRWIINVRVRQRPYFHNINISYLHKIWNFGAEATEMIVITSITKIGMGKSVVFDDVPLVFLVGCTYSLCSLLL